LRRRWALEGEEGISGVEELEDAVDEDEDEARPPADGGQTDGSMPPVWRTEMSMFEPSFNSDHLLSSYSYYKQGRKLRFRS
jgi:hypothetical protein